MYVYLSVYLPTYLILSLTGHMAVGTRTVSPTVSSPTSPDTLRPPIQLFAEHDRQQPGICVQSPLCEPAQARKMVLCILSERIS